MGYTSLRLPRNCSYPSAALNVYLCVRVLLRVQVFHLWADLLCVQVILLWAERAAAQVQVQEH